MVNCYICTGHRHRIFKFKFGGFKGTCYTWSRKTEVQKNLKVPILTECHRFEKRSKREKVPSGNRAEIEKSEVCRGWHFQFKVCHLEALLNFGFTTLFPSMDPRSKERCSDWPCHDMTYHEITKSLSYLRIEQILSIYLEILNFDQETWNSD